MTTGSRVEGQEKDDPFLSTYLASRRGDISRSGVDQMLTVLTFLGEILLATKFGLVERKNGEQT
jgi:hypothetical protein